jgi:hypothetical protein
VGVGEKRGKGSRRVTMVQIVYTHECKRKKKYLLKQFQEWGMRGRKENGEGVNSSMKYLICCKNLYKCHNVPLPSTTIKKKKWSVKKTEIIL